MQNENSCNIEQIQDDLDHILLSEETPKDLDEKMIKPIISDAYQTGINFYTNNHDIKIINKGFLSQIKLLFGIYEVGICPTYDIDKLEKDLLNYKDSGASNTMTT